MSTPEPTLDSPEGLLGPVTDRNAPAGTDADRQGWEEFTGNEAIKRGYEKTFPLFYRFTETSEWKDLPPERALAWWERSVFYRRPKASSVSPPVTVSAQRDQEGPSANPEETRLQAEIMRLTSRLSEETTRRVKAETANLQDLREANALIAELRTDRDRLKAEVSRLQSLLAVAEVAAPGDACSGPLDG